MMNLYQDGKFKNVALRGAPPGLMGGDSRPQPGPHNPLTRLVNGEDLVHIEDLKIYHSYLEGDPRLRNLVDVFGARSLLVVALRKDDALIGTLSAYRQEVRPFTDKQIALLQNFAAQAVIAMENARLLTEQREALQQQTATAEVLEVINASPGNLAPVFDAMLERAVRLSESAFGMMNLYENNRFKGVALRGVPPGILSWEAAPQPGPHNALTRLVNGEDVVHIEDLKAYRSYVEGDPRTRNLVDICGARSLLAVALRKDGKLVGTLTAYRQEVRPFSDKQIALLEGFAAQAVIAIENARLLDELRQRQAELARSVDELTATGDVLKIISRSSVDLKTVLDTLVERVARLCHADQGYMFRRHDELHHLVAAYGVSPAGEEFIRTHPFLPERGTTSGRVAMERRPVQIEDVCSDPEYTYNEGQQIAGFRTMLGIPLLREDTLVGVFVLGRTRVEPFTDKEIELVTSFADQAVIAIENARLFEEIRQRQAELRVTFDNMGDGVAMFDAGLRLAAWNRNFQRIIGLSDADLAARPTYADYLRLLADRGEFGTENVEAALASRIKDTDRELRLERTRADGTVIEARRNAVPGASDRRRRSAPRATSPRPGSGN
jgi:GAF domain-containing protein